MIKHVEICFIAQNVTNILNVLEKNVHSAFLGEELDIYIT